jgi:hypothetical protein
MSRLRPAPAAVKVTVRAQVADDRRKPPPLAVYLPDIPSVPEAWRGSKYVLRCLLGPGHTNPKLARSNAAGTPYKTWGLALAPARESGYQLCSSSSPGCRRVCLHHQGHARLDPAIAVCRVAKTVAWKEHPDLFRAQLVHELALIRRRAEARGFLVAVRLNLTSDARWEKECSELFETFPEFRYYDYTKHHARMMRFLAGDFPPNYHLTYSRSEDNEADCREVLSAGGNVAVVFRDRNFPARYLGAPVIDGDETDLRFLDPKGVVVGLSAKGTAKRDESGFVLDTDTSRISLPLLI